MACRWSALSALPVLLGTALGAEPAAVVARFETADLRWEITGDGRQVALVDRAAGADLLTAPGAAATVKRGAQVHPATAVSLADGRLTLTFAAAQVEVDLQVTARPHYLVVEVVGYRGEPVDALTFVQLATKLKGHPSDSFACCGLALNLRARVMQMPGHNSTCTALAYPVTGFVGAKVALVAGPSGELRARLQEVLKEASELPYSPLGGPWALDHEQNRGSYLITGQGITEANVADWIALVKSLGISQIDFHGGRSFRFGDCLPAPDLYPRGVDSVKAVIDQLHAAGILAGLHTYAHFVARNTPWVTPVPDPRLGKDATFTLTGALDATAAALDVAETTAGMSAITGFAVRNSVTLQIDDELLTYTGVTKEPPYRFTGLKRGAWGTTAAAHPAGAKVHHLRECFGLFTPDGSSTMLAEVAAKTAEFYNRAGFDMMYLDALDGEDVLGPPGYGWHFGAKFAHEIQRRLDRPATMEMSTFHHHLWQLRSRIGAWDHANRSYLAFVDLHVASNEQQSQRIFIPGHLGWWAFTTWNGRLAEPTLEDDVEYLCAKALGTGTGLSVIGITPDNVKTMPAMPRLAAIVRQWEALRRANYFTDEVKVRLREPRQAFTLVRRDDGEWGFRPVAYLRRTVDGLDAGPATWTVTNPHGAQPAGLRIEALQSGGPYDAADNPTLAPFAAPDEFQAKAAPGIEATLTTTSDARGGAGGVLTAINRTAKRPGSWCQWTRTFDPPLNLATRLPLGLWVEGDGSGALLNVQLTSPPHQSRGYRDHYVTLDFAGWRYLELVEPEAARHADYVWPYGGLYQVYRELPRPESVAALTLFLNDLPPGRQVRCVLSPIRALTTIAAKWSDPAVTIGGQTVRFPGELEAGQVLECRRSDQATVYGPAGQVVRQMTPVGDLPTVAAGDSPVSFTCQAAAGLRPRARVTVISQGDWFGGRNPAEQIRREYLREAP